MPGALPRPTRIGLFGGTFDPPHNAHLALARCALASLELDQLRWIPAGQPWQKSRVITPGAQRAAMVALAIAGEPRFVLDERELQRSGPSYTLDTVRELAAEHPGALLFLVIGADQHAGLHSWQGWQELLQRVQLAVAARPGERPAPQGAVAAAPLHHVPLPPMAIAATDIRARAGRGDDIAALVPAAVARYIGRHHLYSQDAAAH